MALQLAFVLVAIIIGARLGGIGLGVMGGIGLAILTFGFGLQPTSPPIDVMLMIAAVISAASCMQAAGGLDYMVKLAERLLRKNPSQVTILSPIVTYLFTFVAGTGHVAYSVLPVIAEVATETKIRPERYSENNDSCYHYRGTCGRLVLHEGGQGAGRRPGVQKEVDRRLS